MEQNVEGALPDYDRAMELPDELESAEESALLVSVLMERAYQWKMNMRYEDAEADFVKAAEVAQHMHDQDHLAHEHTLAHALRECADFYYDTARHDEALPYLESSSAIRERLLLDGRLQDPMDLAGTYGLRGSIHRVKGALDEAARDQDHCAYGAFDTP